MILTTRRSLSPRRISMPPRTTSSKSARALTLSRMLLGVLLASHGCRQVRLRLEAQLNLVECRAQLNLLEYLVQLNLVEYPDQRGPCLSLGPPLLPVRECP